MNITYRNYTEKDIDGIIQFWNESSGWETDMTRKKFDVRFCNSVLGKSILVLAIENDLGVIAALFCFAPIGVMVKGKRLSCYRPYGAILKENFRQNFKLTSFIMNKHPLQQLYFKGADTALKNGASLLFLIPDPRWGKLLRLMPFQLQQFPLWSFKFPGDIPSLPKDAHIVSLKTDDLQINLFIKKNPPAYTCFLIRNSAFFKWKIDLSDDKCSLKGLYVGNKLVGIFTLRFTDSDGQWLIGDVVTINNDSMLKLTLQAACTTAREEYNKKEVKPGKPYKAAILATSPIERVAASIGFYKDNYNFTLAIHVLDKNVNKSEVAPGNWYISAND